ncbi:MAG: alpha/beta fold hydrolase [Deltaproteobacteria bacterium]|jgi:predicted alpha/beta hydrolase|nr:alpha/beta fold hydrolase [Deltaproteobacteria bacterium]
MSDRWPVRAEDGHELELLVEKPLEPRSALLFVCAMGVDSSYYAPFARAMAERGILIAMCDLRGHGTSSVRPRRGVDFGYREIVESDLPAAVEVARQRAHGLPLYLGGHSLGGQLAMLHVAAAQPPIEGMALVACAVPYVRNWSGRSRAFIRFAAFTFPIAGALLGYVPGDRLGFGGTEARTLMRDWAHNAMTARYELIGSTVDYEAALARIEMDFVTVSIEGDEMGPANAVDFTFDKVPRARGVRLEARLSERKPGAHMRWARDPAGVVDCLVRWFDERLEVTSEKVT